MFLVSCVCSPPEAMTNARAFCRHINNSKVPSRRRNFDPLLYTDIHVNLTYKLGFCVTNVVAKRSSSATSQSSLCRRTVSLREFVLGRISLTESQDVCVCFQNKHGTYSKLILYSHRNSRRQYDIRENESRCVPQGKNASCALFWNREQI